VATFLTLIRKISDLDTEEPLETSPFIDSGWSAMYKVVFWALSLPSFFVIKKPHNLISAQNIKINKTEKDNRRLKIRGLQTIFV